MPYAQGRIYNGAISVGNSLVATTTQASFLKLNPTMTKLNKRQEKAVGIALSAPLILLIAHTLFQFGRSGTEFIKEFSEVSPQVGMFGKAALLFFLGGT
ncbi:MAG TPA: hypothetical protein VEF07_09850, partial [Candidatus Binataceae bacterium]|nr:hypothetical protein [Candidatus Binataceae bacterium]